MNGEEPIACAVRKKLAEKPGMREYLRQGIVNVTALSRKLAKEMNVKNVQAIVSAVKRFRSEVEEEGEEYAKKMQKVLADCKVSLSNDVAVITLPHPVDWHPLEKHLHIKHVVEGGSVTNVIVDDQSMDAFVKTGVAPMAVRRGLAAITVKSNVDFATTPGALIFMLAPISYAGINIDETLSCYNEKILILKSGDAKKAYDIITNNIESARKT